MTAEQVPVSNSPLASPARCEHLLDLLDVAAAGQNGLIVLEDGIDATPLKVTYAELRDRAKVCVSMNYITELSLTKPVEIWHRLA
jgi:hypothetical protein